MDVARCLQVGVKLAGYAAAGLLILVVYELLRASILRRLLLALQRSVSRYLRENRVRLDRFKFTQKHYLREALLDDPELAATMISMARTGEVGIAELHRRVEVYIEEIVPYFNLVSYYTVGFGIARRALSILYDGEWSRANLDAAARSVQPGETVVYVVNHRSNADYVLFAYAMSQQVALSYAVGEWARVWPLETLFKSFGSYFVRRGEKDPLYHEVLRRYIRLIARGGLTQGIFLEGGLSRDGALRPPKVGLLDAMLDVVGREGIDVRFVPVGLNYDRVLEDTNLLREAGGDDRPPPVVRRLGSLFWLLVTLPRAAVARLARTLRGLLRLARKRHFSFGVAAVRAGPGLSFRDFFGERLEEVRGLGREGRKQELLRFAEALMERIGRQVPVTAVPLFCAALVLHGQERLRRDQALALIGTLLRRLREVGAPVSLGPRLQSIELGREHHEDQAGAALHEELFASDEAEEILDLSLYVLRRRRIVRVVGDEIVLRPEGAALRRYYALSLEPHLALLPDLRLR